MPPRCVLPLCGPTERIGGLKLKCAFCRCGITEGNAASNSSGAKELKPCALPRPPLPLRPSHLVGIVSVVLEVGPPCLGNEDAGLAVRRHGNCFVTPAPHTPSAGRETELTVTLRPYFSSTQCQAHARFYQPQNFYRGSQVLALLSRGACSTCPGISASLRLSVLAVAVAVSSPAAEVPGRAQSGGRWANGSRFVTSAPESSKWDGRHTDLRFLRRPAGSRQQTYRLMVFIFMGCASMKDGFDASDDVFRKLGCTCLETAHP